MKVGILIIFIIVVVILIVYIPRIGLKTEAEYPRTFSYVIPQEYLNLFSDVNKVKMTSLRTVNIKFRNSISNIGYNKNYYIQIYKLDSTFNIPVREAINENYEFNHGYHDVPYDINEQYCAEFVYKLYRPTKPSKIYLSLSGNNTQILKKNDSIACYYSNFQNFSIKFQKDADDDIYAKANSDNFLTKEVPLEVLFLKRQKNLYLILMSVNDRAISLMPDMLYNLIIKR
jgi:hypothetical protein